MPKQMIHVASVPAPGDKLTRAQWRQVEAYLEDWKDEVLEAARRHPARSFEEGRAQVEAFAKLLGRIGNFTLPPEAGPTSPSLREARYWVNQYAFHELDDALNAHIGKIKDAILYGLRSAWNPVTVASTLYKLTRDAEVNWRTIARTEMVRAMSAGRLRACDDMGYDRVWCPPHAGACKSCRRLIENRVFPIEQVRDVTNFGRQMRDWVACIPLHPHCRHAWLPYEPEVADEAIEHYRRMEEAGLTDDDKLDAMFDSSGELKPGYAGELDATGLFRTRQDVEDLYGQVLVDAVSVAKTKRRARALRTRTLKLADLRTDLYQRQPDPAKVERFRELLRKGQDLSAPRVSLREDGSKYLLDGQHRVLAAASEGAADMPCEVLTDLTYEDEQRICREAMGEHPTRPEPKPTDRVSKEDRDKARRQRWETGKGHPDYPDGGQTLAELNAAAKSGDPIKLKRARAQLAGKLPPLPPGAVTVHRAHHPDDPHGNGLRAGDWVALAREHAERLFPGAPVHSENVPPEHVTWAGSNEHEWVYRPPSFDDVAKGFFDNPQDGRDPALWAPTSDELREDAHKRIIAWCENVLGHGFQKWTRLYLTGGATSRQWLAHPERDSDVDLQIVVNWPKLREARKEWRKLSDYDLHYALVATVKAGLHDVEIVPGVRLDAFVRPEATVEQFERSARVSHQAVWDVLDWRFVTRGEEPTAAEAYGQPWLEGIGADVALDHPDWLDDARAAVESLQAALDGYLTDPTAAHRKGLSKAYGIVHTMRVLDFPQDGELSRGNFIWQYAVNFGPLMQIKHLLTGTDLGKVWPEYAWTDGPVVQKMAPATGVEHWITVHPHGPDEPGQPVLVRNNSDGSMTVIGGAGGSLNYLRLDQKRRIDDKREKASGKEKASLQADQPISEEERKKQEAEFEQRKTEARKTIEQAQAKRDDADQRLRDYAAQIGYNVDEARVKHANGDEETAEASKTEQRDALKRLQQAALYTLTHGEISRKDANESPWLIERKQGDFEGMEEKPKDEAEVHEPADDNGDTQEPPEDVNSTPDEEIARAKRSMPKLPPLTPEQAQAIMEMQAESKRAQRVQSKARKVLREGGEHSDSLALDWRDADVKEDVSKKVAAEQRTDVARQLVETAEGKQNPAKKRYGQALQQGAYDSIDAFTHAVLGVSAVPPEVGRLLGAAGTAQLAAHAIRQRAAEQGLDMQQALDALEKHTQRQELEVANTALARARKAADTAVQMREERKLSEAGQSLWLQTMTYSYEQKKMGEAARLLGMAIGGMESASALKVALSTPSDKLKVTGFESAGQIKALAQKAGIEVGDADVTRVGAGNYTLQMDADRLSHLLRFDPEPNGALRERLRKLRTPGQLKAEVEKAQSTPGMAQTLDESQARGKLVLTSTADAGGGCVLAFAPGRGKTHTALAAALQRMSDEGVPQGQGNTWVVCPTTAMAEWAGTISMNSTRSVQMIGKEFEHLGEGKIESRGRSSKTAGQLAAPADFNIVSFEHLQSLLQKHPELADQVKAARVITDESQKIKNPGKQTDENKQKRNRWQTLSEFSKHTTERWALSGTTVEKRLRDLGAQYHWANPERSLSPAQMEAKFGKLGQSPHVLGQDQIQQFREGLDEGLYQLGADDANLPEVEARTEHKIDLDEEHQQVLQNTAKSINEQRAEAKARGLKGISGIDAERIMRQALYERPDNALAKKVGEIVDSMPDIDYEGDENGENAGTYGGKAIVFSQFVKQLDHVVAELEGGDHKVFYAHGGMTSEENEKQLQGFLAHKGRAVLVSSDKNSTARSLQFGKNKGKFQHGATTMVHYSQPDNNATIQQREARIRRKGAATNVPVQYHTLNAGTPAEVRQQDRLEEERRTQQLAGNSEQMVGGRDTLHHLLDRERAKAAA